MTPSAKAPTNAKASAITVYLVTVTPPPKLSSAAQIGRHVQPLPFVGVTPFGSPHRRILNVGNGSPSFRGQRSERFPPTPLYGTKSASGTCVLSSRRCTGSLGAVPRRSVWVCAYVDGRPTGRTQLREVPVVLR